MNFVSFSVRNHCLPEIFACLLHDAVQMFAGILDVSVAVYVENFWLILSTSTRRDDFTAAAIMPKQSNRDVLLVMRY